jgi:hypothetical protein
VERNINVFINNYPDNDPSRPGLKIMSYDLGRSCAHLLMYIIATVPFLTGK